MDLQPPGLHLHRHLLFRSVLVLTFIPQLSACGDLVLLVHHVVTPEFPLSAFLCPLNPAGPSPFDPRFALVHLGVATQPHGSWLLWTSVTSFIPCLDREPPLSSRLGSQPLDPATTCPSTSPVAPATMPLCLESLFRFSCHSGLPWILLGVGQSSSSYTYVKIPM